MLTEAQSAHVSFLSFMGGAAYGLGMLVFNLFHSPSDSGSACGVGG